MRLAPALSSHEWVWMKIHKKCTMLMFYMGHVIWQMLIKTVEPERTGHFRSFELHRELIQTVLKAFNVFSGSLWPTISTICTHCRCCLCSRLQCDFWFIALMGLSSATDLRATSKNGNCDIEFINLCNHFYTAFWSYVQICMHNFIEFCTIL